MEGIYFYISLSIPFYQNKIRYAARYALGRFVFNTHDELIIADLNLKKKNVFFLTFGSFQSFTNVDDTQLYENIFTGVL